MLCQICVRTDDALPEVDLDLTLWEREQESWWDELSNEAR